MLERVMLILIGGRSAVPAVVGALQFIEQVDRVKFLVCSDEKYIGFQQRAEKVLKQECITLNCEEADIKAANPVDFNEVYTSVNKLCKEGQEVEYVNLTGAPQAMAIAVYSCITAKYPKALIFTINTDQAQLTPLILGREPLSLIRKLTVEDYAISCGVEIAKKKPAQALNDYLERTRPLIDYFVENIQVTDSILAEIRRKAGGGDSIKAPRGFTLDSEKTKQNIAKTSLESFFRELEESLVIQKLKIAGSEISYQIQTNEDYAFLSGNWLEFFVYDAAQKCQFDSVEMGVDLGEERGGEIDIVCVSGVNVMICECKTGDPSKFGSDVLSKLKFRGDKFGGNYCVKLFITNQELSESFVNKAKDSEIFIVSGKNLKSLPEILSREMQTPTYHRR